jgi:hypothetical protein
MMAWIGAAVSILREKRCGDIHISANAGRFGEGRRWLKRERFFETGEVFISVDSARPFGVYDISLAYGKDVMTRQNLIYGSGILVLVLVVLGAILVARRPPEPGTAAAFRALSAASATPVPHAVSMPARRAAADTCQGYNLELEEGAGIQIRIGNHAEAQRLMSMRQDCRVANPNVIRSAR